MPRISKELQEFKKILELDKQEYLNEEDLENYDLHLLIKSFEEEASYIIDKRTYLFADDIDWLYKKSDWKDIKSIGVVIKEIDNVVVEVRYFISNLESKYVKLIANVIRNEWAIENKLHWYLDMCFQEDKNKCYLKNSQKNLNIIRKFCLAILKLVKDKYKLSMNSLRLKLSMNFEKELEKLLNNL